MTESRGQNRIPPLDPERATGTTKQLFDDMRQIWRRVQPFSRAREFPAALEAYVNFSSALSLGTLDARVQELIGLTVAERNLCGYCLKRTHSIGWQNWTLSSGNRRCHSIGAADGKTDAILKLARSIIVQRGEVTDIDLQHARDGGLTDCEIVETVANVVLNIDHVARPTVDFPQIEPGDGKEPTSESDGIRIRSTRWHAAIRSMRRFGIAI